MVLFTMTVLNTEVWLMVKTTQTHQYFHSQKRYGEWTRPGGIWISIRRFDCTYVIADMQQREMNGP